MKTYYYQIQYDKCITNPKRGMNRYIAVYSIAKDGTLNYHGEDWHDSASWMGPKAIAAQILSEDLNYELTKDKYNLVRTDIQLIQFP